MRVENGVLKLTGQSVRELAKTKEKEFKADIRQKRQQQVEALKTARTQISANKAEILSLQEKMKALNIANSASAALQTQFCCPARNKHQQYESFSWLAFYPMKRVIDQSTKHITKRLKQHKKLLKQEKDKLAKSEQYRSYG
ncbi:hypothetical protein [Paenibacillus sp. Mc5Re-14]|uniref:hypothetical protein n=1 Tax=Paenibacillus sp. Mc5Re-14 TaxID=1030529 RepID=UPI000B035D51|nr:hypothetical protein [Paenibacillus sp. Mc5Re-14]